MLRLFCILSVPALGGLVWPAVAQYEFARAPGEMILQTPSLAVDIPILAGLGASVALTLGFWLKRRAPTASRS
ncbi:hypothetical protein [Phenylobacterium sp.]|uniref:hypothetical protein n=1 Tax=Phenylobacterium sp. TaxID=1871053 RepID=UPI0035B3B56E